MKRKILLVEDEEELCITLGDRLRSEGYAVEIAGNARSGLEKASSKSCDLIILDLMLPQGNGFDVCTGIRSAGLKTPILILTALGRTAEKVLGLKLGADDYVTKPFDSLELIARIEALLRRSPSEKDPGQPGSSGVYRFGNIVMDVERRTVTRGGEPVTLSWREFQLLRYFAENPNVTLSRDTLLHDVWGQKVGTITRTIDVHVAILRQKIEEQPREPRWIQTVPGMGYRFDNQTH